MIRRQSEICSEDRADIDFSKQAAYINDLLPNMYFSISCSDIIEHIDIDKIFLCVLI